MSQNKRIVLIFLCVLLGMTGCGAKSSKEESAILQTDNLVSERVNFKTTTVSRGDLSTETSMKARVTYFNSTSLYFQQKAHFVQFYVEEGQHVKKGDLLAECQIQGTTQKLTQIQTQMTLATTELDNLKADYEHDKSSLSEYLSQSNGTERELYQLLLEQKELRYKYTIQQITEQIQALETEKKRYEETNENSHLYAITEGVIDKLAYLSEGDEIDTQRWMIKMHDESVSYIQVSDEKEVLSYHMIVTVQADNNGRQNYEGKVVCADQILEGELKTGYAYIQLEDKSINLSDLKNIVVAATVQELKDVLVVDRAAVYTAGGKKYVLVLEDGVIKKRYITVGLEGTDQSYILDGVREGEEVIIES